MDCEVCSSTTAANYGDVAFRLPSLKQKYDDLALKYRDKICPREARVIAAFENRKEKKRRNATFANRTIETRLYNSTRDQEQDGELCEYRNKPIALQTSSQAIEFIFRELTEITEVIERSKNRLRTETIQGLWRVITGVLHSMGQDILKTAFCSHISNIRYENFSQAIPLSPRYLQKLEKREPITRTPQVCRGCQAGGRLPWIYLYPDREVYRTGGGFDCIEFELPVIKSEKPTTKAKDPFSKNRGKLVETKQHHLPKKRKHNLKNDSKKPVRPENEEDKLEFYLELPRVSSYYSSMSDLSEMDQSYRTSTDKSESSTRTSKNGAYRLSPLTTSRVETNLMASSSNEILEEQEEPKESTSLSMKKQKEVTFQTIINELNIDNSHAVDKDLEETDLSKTQTKTTNDIGSKHKPEKQNSSLHKRLASLKNINSMNDKQQIINAQEPTALLEDSKFARKFINRSPIQTLNPFVFTAVHHSTMLSDKPIELPQKIPISKMKKNSRIHGFGKKKSRETSSLSTSINGSQRSRKASSIMTSLSDMSLQFSSSLSLSNPDIEATEEDGPRFSLTCAKVKPSERKQSTTKKYNAPVYKKTSLSNGSKSDKAKMKTRDEMSEDQRYSSNASLKQNSLLGRSESDRGSSTTYSQDDCLENANNISFSSGLGSEMVSFEKAESLIDGEEMDMFDSTNHYGNNSNDFVQNLEDWRQDETTSSNAKRRKAKRKRTLQFRMEPLSKYTLKRGSREDTDIFEEEPEDDLSMLDYAARYCIISLERLSKYENIFNTFSCREIEINTSTSSDTNKFEAGITGSTDKQKSLLKEFEKLVFGMDIYQQKISGMDKKRVDYLNEQQEVFNMLSNEVVDEERKKLLEATIHTLSSRIAASEENMKQLIGKLKRMMERKKEIQDLLLESGMEKIKVDDLIRNTDFLERRFKKLKNQHIRVNHLPSALKVLNRSFDDEDFAFVNHVLQLPRKESLDFKAFAVVAALAEGVKSLDKSIKALIRRIDLTTLERKLDKCKELYRLLAEEHPDNGKKLVSIDSLVVELRAGGLQQDQQKSVIDRLNHNGHGFLDFIDFVLYVPLFLMIHDQIVGQPLV